MKRKYTAFTLLEMLIVISIIIVIGAIGMSSFLGLHNTVKMNEYMMNLEQDIRAIQRASLLLERNVDENWLYGIGIDFRNVDPDGNYIPFKWCTPDRDYGHISTTSIVPAYEPGITGSEKFPHDSEISGTFCGADVGGKEQLRTLPGYERSLTIPKANIFFGPEEDQEKEGFNPPKIVVFESVSGRAFFYSEDGKLLNYEEDEDGRLVMKEPDELQNLMITIEPIARGTPRQITIQHLSGRVHN